MKDCPLYKPAAEVIETNLEQAEVELRSWLLGGREDTDHIVVPLTRRVAGLKEVLDLIEASGGLNPKRIAMLVRADKEKYL